MLDPNQLAFFEYLLHTGPTPTRAYDDDAGFDLVVATDWRIDPHEVTEIPLAQAIKSPEGHWALLIGRSSTFRRGLLMNPGVIDTGYTGPLYAVVHNMLAEPVHVKQGERIAQLIPFETVANRIVVRETDQLPKTKRGTNGFGSSGR